MCYFWFEMPYNSSYQRQRDLRRIVCRIVNVENSLQITAEIFSEGNQLIFDRLQSSKQRLEDIVIGPHVVIMKDHK